MRYHRNMIRTTALLLLVGSAGLPAHTGPFDGREFKGRIAFSSDGNYNDEDDWGAFPVAIALLDAFGVTGKLVHVDYCNILGQNDPRFYREMVESVLGTAERYVLPRAILFDCQKDLNGALESIRGAIDASSADNPLYFVLAGPMEVPLLGIRKSDPAKRKHVYCISHSVWNDGFPQPEKEHLHRYSKRDIIQSGVHWVQIKAGSGLTDSTRTSSTPEQWALYHWMRDSKEARLGWIYSRLRVEDRCDVSDATMTYFLVTGDEEATAAKLRAVLAGKRLPAPADPRKAIRIEAENFPEWENVEMERRGYRSASHRLSVRLPKVGTGRIRTSFDEPYAADRGLYDVEVRYSDEERGGARLALCVNGVQQDASWTASADTTAWQSRTVAGVTINAGDEIMIEVQGDGRETTRLDFVQLHYRAQGAAEHSSR
ncbi:MAG: hypothetical protein MUC88_22285 [Planctomycetes bacterium]|nr:hypothetical protein [Planctomycetota bacterium]